MKIKYLALTLFISLSMTAVGQDIITINGKEFSGNKGYIYGKLMDKETGEDIIGAIVSIPAEKEATVTDINGEFRLQVSKGRNHP